MTTRTDQSSTNDAKRLLEIVIGILELSAAAFAALSPTVLPIPLVPVQLAAVKAAAALLFLVAFVFALTSRKRILEYKTVVVSGSILLAVAVVALNAGFVVTVEEVGDDDETVYSLVGWELTEFGEARVERAGLTNASRERIVEAFGVANVPRLWGSSYHAVRWTYFFCLCSLIFTVVLGLVSLALAQLRQSHKTDD